jgi:hypothetical protein
MDEVPNSSRGGSRPGAEVVPLVFSVVEVLLPSMVDVGLSRKGGLLSGGPVTSMPIARLVSRAGSSVAGALGRGWSG